MTHIEIRNRSDSASTADLLEVWLVEQGLRGARVETLMRGFCERAIENGLPLARCFIGLNTLHPHFRGYSFVWRRGQGDLMEETYLRRDADRTEYLSSPFHHMFENRLFHLRQRLDAPAEPHFEIYDSFRKQGGTDYAVWLVGFLQDGRQDSEDGMLFSVLTDREGGFSDQELQRMQRLLQLLGLAVRCAATYETAGGVLGAYLGPDAGKRVLDGEIDRGALQSIRAVIIISDLRGFTRAAERMPADALVAMLDQYLEIMTEAVIAPGGNVLKFLGDGLLAVFQLEGTEEGQSCHAGTGAAVRMLTETARLNDERRVAGLETLELDVAVHVGDVLYGNVGAEGRLDFTVIGPAVNETSRMETMCRELGVNVLFSDAFYANATVCRQVLQPVGKHVLRDLEGARQLYTLRPGVV